MSLPVVPFFGTSFGGPGPEPAYVEDVYRIVCIAMMEDTGLQLGILTDQQFLGYFGAVMQDFLQKSGLVKSIFTQTAMYGIGEYTVPDDQGQIQECFVGGQYLQLSSVQELDNYDMTWQRRIDQPEVWHQDGLPIKTIEVVPAPNFQGVLYPGSAPPVVGKYGDIFPADQNISIVATQGLAQTLFSLDLSAPTPIPVIPASFTIYIAYGVMERIFASDSESKDGQRALYTGARYREGIALAKAIREEVLCSDYTPE